jgi:PAT family beta-lactamase induction signal transducer AmpG
MASGAVPTASVPPNPGWGRRVAAFCRSPHSWVSTTYFAEGFPYSIVHSLSEAIFVARGASLEVLGVTSLFHLPWNLKFAWGPWLDRYGTKRAWLLGTEILISLVLLAAAAFAAPGFPLGALTAVFVVVAFIAATHDIAIDAYYLEALDDDGQSNFVGYRAAGYRVAMLAVGGGLVGIGPSLGWSTVVVLSAAIMAGLTLWHARMLPRVEGPKLPFRELLRALLGRRLLIASLLVAGLIYGLRDVVTVKQVVRWSAVGLLSLLAIGLASLPLLKRKHRDSEDAYARALVSFLDQRAVVAILGFTLCFRLGESFLGKMKLAFLHREVGMSMEHFGMANGTVGVVALFTATLIGGRLISRDGLRKWIWPFVLGQNLLNLLYAAMAWFHVTSLEAQYLVVGIERFGEGLGTAVFMVFLMRCCDPEHKAAHFAIVSALMSVGFTLAGTVSGQIAEALGFANYFAFSFLATVPGMLLIFVLPHLDGRENAQGDQAASAPEST